jgi:hypothetical protein
MNIRLYTVFIVALFLSWGNGLSAYLPPKNAENSQITMQAYDEFDQLADAAQEVAPAVTAPRAKPVELTTLEQWKRNFLDFVLVQYLTLKKMLNKIF